MNKKHKGIILLATKIVNDPKKLKKGQKYKYKNKK